MHVLLAAGSHAELQGREAGTAGLLVADGLCPDCASLARCSAPASVRSSGGTDGRRDRVTT